MNVLLFLCLVTEKEQAGAESQITFTNHSVSVRDSPASSPLWLEKTSRQFKAF